MEQFKPFIEEIARSNDRAFYSLLLDLMKARAVTNLQSAVTDIIPGIFIEARKAIGRQPRAFFVQTGGALEVRKVQAGETALYWNGNGFDARPHPGALTAWADDYTAFARKVLEVIRTIPTPTIIDLGSGTGALEMYIAHLCDIGGLDRPRMIAVERDEGALEFSKHMSDATGVEIEHLGGNVMDLSRIPFGNANVLITKSALHPFFTAEQFERLFAMLRQQCIAGIHLELTGDRTPAYERFRDQFPDAPKMKATFSGWPFDASTFVADNAPRFGIEITERIEIWPHFPHQNYPSFLSWRAKS